MALGIVVTASFLGAETLGVLLLKQVEPHEAFETLYLLGVLVVSTLWGVTFAVAASVTSAIALTFVRNWPSPHVVPLDLDDYVVIATFVVVALLTSFVADLARTRAADAEQRRREASRLAEQHAALRRTATLVARGVSPAEVFAAVTEEIVRCLHVANAAVLRYEAGGSFLVVGSYDTAAPVPLLGVGDQITPNPDDDRIVVMFGDGESDVHPRRDATTPQVDPAQKLDSRPRVFSPIVVDGVLWGAATTCSTNDDELPADTAARLTDFADLIATSLANAATRAELIASRARIVTAADDARRRLERDLHDGAQQRLISLALQVRDVKDSVPPGLDHVDDELSNLLSCVIAASRELQDISRGIHPAILSQGGLDNALHSLARRSPVPVVVDATVAQALPEHLEVAAYYVVAEVLTNVAKYAHASEVTVDAQATKETLLLTVADDGIGGANPAGGSGLIGLQDRVEALGGQMQIVSPPGNGTVVRVRIPLTVT